MWGSLVIFTFIKESILISQAKVFSESQIEGCCHVRIKIKPFSFVSFLRLRAFAARAEEAPPTQATAQAKPAGGDPASHLPPDSVTQHTITLGGQQLAYKATAGTLPLFGAKGEIAARIFLCVLRAGQRSGAAGDVRF